MDSYRHLQQKRIVMLLGSQRPAPTIAESNTISRRLTQIVDNLPGLDIHVISQWHPGLSRIQYDRRRYHHVKPTIAHRVTESVIARLPYRLRKRWFGVANPAVLTYYLAQAMIARRLAPDVVVSHMAFPLLRIAEAAIPKAKHVFYFVSSNLDSWPREDVNVLFQKADGIVSVCQAAFEGLTAKYGPLPVPTKVVYNGVDFSVFNQDVRSQLRCQARQDFGLTGDDVVLLYAGRLAREKGIAQALSAYLRAKKTHPHLKFFIAGDDKFERNPDVEFANELRSLVRNCDPAGVRLVGWFPQRDLINVYAAADISVLASIEIEGNPNFILESMACGLPVISTAVGGVPEIIQDGRTGYLIDPTNIEQQLCEKLAFLVDSPDRRSAMGHEGMECVKRRHSYEQTARDLAEFLTRISTQAACS